MNSGLKVPPALGAASLPQAFNGMSVEPRLILKEPAKGDRYLQVLIALRSRRYRTRVLQHLTAQLSKFNDSVTSLEGRHLVDLGHVAPHGSGGSLTELSVTENCRGRGGDRDNLARQVPA
jgi:hypothetical protein